MPTTAGLPGVTDRQTGGSDPYAEAGVSVAAGNDFVRAIGQFVARTKRPGFAAGIGGFGGVFDLKACGYQDPLLVAATDGIGTKLLLGIAADRLEPLGQDLVAMCVNDLVVQGAEPLFFLDYLATGKLEPGQLARLVDGISAALAACNCALIGGETAEMPGLYDSGHFDAAGFALGAVERDRLLPKPSIQPGDQLIGLPSSGLHSNGFSLVRKILREQTLSIHDPAPFAPGKSLADCLLVPTQLYVTACLALAKADLVLGLAHITGGGLSENIPRVLPDGLGAVLRHHSWALPPEQQWLAEQGEIGQSALFRTFNGGIGMVVIVSPDQLQPAMDKLASMGEAASLIGEVVADPAGMVSFAA